MGQNPGFNVLVVGIVAFGLLHAAPGCASSRLRRWTQAEDTGPNYVKKEAFDKFGNSLGLADDATNNWTVTNVNLQETAGDPEYKYHAEAYYYLVGNNDSLILEFWHPFDDGKGGKDMAAVHLNVARRMVLETRKGGDQMTIKVVNKGWSGLNDEMCSEDVANVTCPALVLAGTTQMAARYSKGDTLALNQYMASWAEQQGRILTDDFIKYYFYDFNYDGTWVAVPLVSDTRVLAYNSTTFRLHDLTPPPALTEDRWNWTEFVNATDYLTRVTKRPGWYFKGSYDEELKISLMIARNWGATLYAEDEMLRKSCALGDDFVDAMEATIETMLKNGWMSGVFVNETSAGFTEWMEKGYKDFPVVVDPASVPKGLEPDFSANSSELWGMTVVAPGTLKDILSDDIEEALVPGLFSFLGGSGLFVNAKASKEQQDLGWELLKRMILDVSNYALVQRSPPPLESALEGDTEWALDKWSVPVKQLRSATPAQYPNPGFAEFQDVEASKPFRLMWLEMKYKNYTSAQAAERLSASINFLLQTVCTEEDHDDARCRSCTTEDYSYEVDDCDPDTQKRQVMFHHNPQNGSECFGGVQTPDDTRSHRRSPTPNGDTKRATPAEGASGSGDVVWSTHEVVLIPCGYVEVTSRFGIAIITVSCVGGVLAIVAAILVYAYRRRPVIKFSQPRFCVLFSLGVAGMCLGNLALVGPNTSGSCVARITVWGVAFDLAFGALFSKVYRVRRVIQQARGRRQRTRRSFLPLVSVVSLAMVVDMLVLTMWSILDDHGPFDVTEEIGDTVAFVTTKKCSSEGGTWSIVFISFKIVLIGWGCYLAWVTRRINHALVEGREISWSIYLFAVLGVILIFIWWAGLRVEYWALAKAFVYSLSSCTALVMVLVPKLWGAHKNVHVNVHDLTQEVSSMRVNPASVGTTIETSNDSDHADASGPLLVQCCHCSATFDVTSHIRPGKGMHMQPPLFAPRAGAGGVRTAVVGGWQGDVIPARGGWHGDSTDPNNYNATRFQGGTSNYAVGDKTCSGESDSSETSGAVHGDRKRNAGMALGAVGGGAGDKNGVGAGSQNGNGKVQYPAPSQGGAGVFRETEVGLALKLTKIERGCRRSPASSTGGIPSLGGRPPSFGMSNSGRDVGRVRAGGIVVLQGAATAPTRKKGSWRGSWKRQSKEDSMLSSSPHSELDAASFSRSLQAQAAAMRAALWSSTHTSQHSENESTSKKLSTIGRGSFGRRAAAVTPAKSRGRASATPGSMRAALNAGRIAATADAEATGTAAAAASPAVAATGTGNGRLSVTTNPLHLGVVGGGGGVRTAADGGRPPAHRIPGLRLDSPGINDNNPLVTPPPGRYLLQPWVGGRRPARSVRRAVGGAFNLRSARIESHAITSQASPGMSSAASYSPPVEMEASSPWVGRNTVSSISPASATSSTHGFGIRWDEESKIAEPIDTHSAYSSTEGSAKIRKLVPTPDTGARGAKALRRGASALWGSIDKCDSPPPSPMEKTFSTAARDPPGLETGAAKTRKLVETPQNSHRIRRARGVGSAGIGSSSGLANGVSMRNIHVQEETGMGGPAAGPEGEEAAPAADTLDETSALEAQWARETGGHML